jgi:hypothetical protein
METIIIIIIILTLIFALFFIFTKNIILFTSNFKNKKWLQIDKNMSSSIINMLLKFKKCEINILKNNNKNIIINIKIISNDLNSNKKIKNYLNNEINKIKDEEYKNILESFDIQIDNIWDEIIWNIKLTFIDENFYENSIMKINI